MSAEAEIAFGELVGAGGARMERSVLRRCLLEALRAAREGATELALRTDFGGDDGFARGRDVVLAFEEDEVGNRVHVLADGFGVGTRSGGRSVLGFAPVAFQAVAGGR